MTTFPNPALHPSASAERAPAQPAKGQLRQLLGLDLLRFFAALLVVGFHYLWGAGSHAFYPWARVPQNYAWVGYVGVQIFFVLSGFVIAYSAQRSSASEFARTRLIRLYPAAWVCATITLLALIIGGQAPGSLLSNYIRAICLSPVGPWIDGVYWTLSVELSFYLIIFLLLLTRLYHLVGVVMSTVGIVSTVCVLYGAAYQRNWFHVPHLGGRYAYQVFVGDVPVHLLLPLGAFFALGTLLWLCLFDRVTPGRVIVALICFAGGFIQTRVQAGWLTDGFPSRHWIAGPAIWTLAVVAIIVSVRRNAAFHHKVGLKGARIIRRLGLLTYPLYLLHQLAGYVVLEHLTKHLPYMLCTLITAALAIAAALAINLFAEEPLQRWLKNAIPFRKKASMPAASLP